MDSPLRDMKKIEKISRKVYVGEGGELCDVLHNYLSQKINELIEQCEADKCSCTAIHKGDCQSDTPSHFNPSEEDLLRIARESSCLQRIQLIVRKYMEQPMKERNAIDIADAIFKDVKKTLSL